MKLNPRRVSELLILGSILGSFSCASMSRRDDEALLSAPGKDGWESEKKRRRRAPYEKKRKLIDKHQTIKTLAKGFASADECYRRAKSNSANNLAASWALVRACIQYRGYSKLEELIEEPWIRIHRANWKDSSRLIAQLVAMRGGNVELDVGICARQQLELRNLDEVLRDAEGERNALVLFRAKVIGFRTHKSRLRLELSTTSGDAYATIAAAAFKPRASKDYVFLGYFKGAGIPEKSAVFTEAVSTFRLLAAYPIADAR